MTAPETPSPATLAADLERTARHLRHLPQSRLARRHSELDDDTTADAAHAFAGWLATAAAGLAAGSVPPVGRRVPRLSDLAVGDQVAVTGAELVAAATSAQDADAVGPVLAEALRRSALLRRVT